MERAPRRLPQVCRRHRPHETRIHTEDLGREAREGVACEIVGTRRVPDAPARGYRDRRPRKVVGPRRGRELIERHGDLIPHPKPCHQPNDEVLARRLLRPEDRRRTHDRPSRLKDALFHVALVPSVDGERPRSRLLIVRTSLAVKDVVAREEHERGTARDRQSER